MRLNNDLHEGLGEHEFCHFLAHQDALPLFLDLLLGISLDAGVFEDALQLLTVVAVDDIEEVFLVQSATLVQFRRHILLNFRSHRELIVQMLHTDLGVMTSFDWPEINKWEEILLSCKSHPNPLLSNL